MRNSDERGLGALSLDLARLALFEADFQVSSSNADQSSQAHE